MGFESDQNYHHHHSRPVGPPPGWYGQPMSVNQQTAVYSDDTVHTIHDHTGPIWIPPHEPVAMMEFQDCKKRPMANEWQINGHNAVAQPPHYHFAGDRHPAFFAHTTLPPSTMALPGHSPAYTGPGSPPRPFIGYSEPPAPPIMYGPPRPPMPPPSPQHFPPRFSQAPPPAAALPTAVTHTDSRPPPPAPKRPGSSMSISSMLGAEPEKPGPDPYPNHASRTPSRHASVSGPSMSLGAVMSPPQYPSKAGIGEYSYKPRSQTPDGLSEPMPGTRPHRSSSGTMIQPPGPFYEQQQNRASSKPLLGRVSEQAPTPPFGASFGSKDDLDDRTRRTSISGLLQRSESQPRPSTALSGLPQNPPPPSRADSIPASVGSTDRFALSTVTGDTTRPHGPGGAYDTRPPGIAGLSRPPASVSTTLALSASADRPFPPSLSPELRRLQPNGSENRGLAGILNQQSEGGPNAPSMVRQDSMQSQTHSERSVFGDRSRFRAYSPFAGSATSGGPVDEQGRKSSEEVSQHRAILGLSAESKRGRYSPVPQAVQGAQAHTPVPDAGIKTEHGRVFSGIGSGIGTTSTGPTATSNALPASPFKRDEGTSRLSEENLMKMSRSASGMGKRPRNFKDDEGRAESDMGDSKRHNPSGRGSKRGKFQNSYKADLEEVALGQRRNTPLSMPTGIRGAASSSTVTPQPLHHQLLRQSAAVEHGPIFKPKQTIRITSVLALARRNPRRHLGSFKYNPEVTNVDIERPGTLQLDVSVHPTLLPSFTDPDHVNCTYTVRVPRLWLQPRERGLVCAERYLWGSGIYTDDSDPLAAAMHAGFIEAVHPNGVDETLLDKIIGEQNPKIEGSPAPEKPQEIEEGKDLHITLLVLPQLERYHDSVRFGIKSRSWPEDQNAKTPHDGVSFMVLKTEFVDDGVEARRVGRTGKEKRERLKRELEERKRGLEIEKAKIEQAEKKIQEEREKRKREKEKRQKELTTSSTTTPQPALKEEPTPAPGLENVGQAPGDWIAQLTAVAA